MTTLDLSDCQLDDEALGRWVKLCGTSNLNFLDFPKKKLFNFPSSWTRLAPVFGHVEELNLSDNNFTWYHPSKCSKLSIGECIKQFLFRYGIKKLSGVHRRTKPLKKLDMSRCQLSQNGFYELIPIILKSEHVILQVKTPPICQILSGIILNSPRATRSPHSSWRYFLAS